MDNPYDSILKAAAKGKGANLTAAECRYLADDDHIRDMAESAHGLPPKLDPETAFVMRDDTDDPFDDDYQSGWEDWEIDPDMGCKG